MPLLDDVRQAIRLRHYSYQTEKTYVDWVERYVRFHKGPGGWRHPRDLGAAGVERFLTHLAADRRVAAGQSDGKITVWELASGQRLTTLAGHDSPVREVAFTRDGRRVIGNADLSPALWGLCPKDLPGEGCWGLLASADAATAYRAQWGLITRAAAAVKLLGEHVRTTELAVRRARFDRWVADLDSPQFRVREAAEKELTTNGEVPLEWVGQALANATADESRTRLGRVLAGREKGPVPEALRLSRAVQVLEWTGTAEARALLKAWAAAPGSPVAGEAAGALGRLGLR